MQSLILNFKFSYCSGYSSSKRVEVSGSDILTMFTTITAIRWITLAFVVLIIMSNIVTLFSVSILTRCRVLGALCMNTDSN